MVLRRAWQRRRLVAQGEDILITRHGKPVARLVPPDSLLIKKSAATAAERIRENAKAEGLGRFDCAEWRLSGMKEGVEPGSR